MPEKIDLTGKKFGKLLVIDTDTNKGGRTAWECECDCGNCVTVITKSLVNGHTQSCGCRKSEANKERITHGHRQNGFMSATYVSWRAMIDRCTLKKHKHYKDYGGRGIKICARWGNFQNFLSDMGERPTGKTLDRKEVNGNYEPDNCRWATPKQQNGNRRNSSQLSVSGRRR